MKTTKAKTVTILVAFLVGGLAVTFAPYSQAR